ncbi:hypothetical protein M1N93_02535 [Dehalococcoidia bacterium]|nr:hypothetical protein [Dehalococcoidia bacterium]
MLDKQRVEAICNLSDAIADAITHAPVLLNEKNIVLAIKQALADVGMETKITVKVKK